MSPEVSRHPPPIGRFWPNIKPIHQHHLPILQLRSLRQSSRLYWLAISWPTNRLVEINHQSSVNRQIFSILYNLDEKLKQNR